MAHAEKCPVCTGSGYIIPYNDYSQTAVPLPQACHGCDGKGWIVVSDSTNNEAYDVTDLYGITYE